MGNTLSTTPPGLDGKEGEAAARLGLGQHEDPEAPHSIGNQEQTVSVKPADPEFISCKQPSDSLVTPAIIPLPSKALSSASPLVLSSREISTASRSSSPRTAHNDGSSLILTTRAHQPSGEGVSDQHTEDRQRTPKSSGGDNRAVGVKNRQDPCGRKGNGEKRLTKDGAWQRTLDSTTTVTRARALCDPIVSNEKLQTEQDEEEHAKQTRTRLHRGGHRGSHRVWSCANATRVRDEKGTPPVSNVLGEGKSSRRVGNGEVESIIRRSARATVYRKHPVINMDHSGDGSIGSERSGNAPNKKVSSENIRERPQKERGITRLRARERSSPVDNEEQPVDSVSPLLRLPVANESAEGEVLSVSSAKSGIAQEDCMVSTSYLLPPLEVAGPRGGIDSTFEDSSIEDSVTSASLASSSDKGDNVDARRGNRGGPTPRHRGSSDAFVRIRSKGSLSLARIHEQEEGREAQRPPNRRASRGLCSSNKNIESDCFEIQELSELDEETLEKGAAAAAAADGAECTVTGAETSSVVALPRVTLDVATSTIVELGHQRATLELRNLMLEREVEQLKACLRSMRGDNIDFLQQNVQGRQQQGHKRGSAMGASSLTAVTRKGKSASIPVILRSVAPMARRHQDSGDVLYGSKRGKTIHVRELALLDHDRVEVELSAAGGSHETRSGKDAAGEDVTQTSSPPTSPPICDNLVSDSRTSERLQVPSGVPSVSTASRNFHGCFSSPARHLRTTMPPSFESTLGAAGEGFDATRVGVVAGGTHSFSARGKSLKKRTTSRSGSINVAIRTHKDQERRDSKIGSGLGHSSEYHETPSTLFVKKKPLPRLSAGETDRRRKVIEKSEISKVPGYLVMDRRRSTGMMVSAHLAPASIAEQTAVNVPHGRSGGRGDRGAGRSRDSLYPLPRQITAGHKHREEAGNKGNATTSQQVERDERKCATRRPARRDIVGSASSSAIADPMTMTEASTAAAGAVKTASSTSDLNEHARGSPCLREVDAGKVGRQRRANSRPALKGRAAKDGGSGVQTQTVATAVKMTTNSSVLDATDTVDTSKVRGTAAVASSRERVSAERREAVQVLPPPRVVQQEGREWWPVTLDARWAEVEFVLCRRVDCKESFEYTAEATKESLMFIGKLEKKAQELGVLKGQLSRWLLPFNTNTLVEEQQAATPRGLQDSLQASSTTSVINGVGVLSEEEARYLTDGARKVRQLVRLKIADDNDLNTAKEALITVEGFFDSLAEEAARRGGTVTAFDILQERRAISPISRPPPLPSIPRSSSIAAVATSTSCTGDNERAAAATYTGGASSKVSNANNGRTVLPTSSGGAGSLPTRKIEGRPDLGGGSGGDGRELKRRNGGGSYLLSPTTTTIGTAAVVSETTMTHPKEHAIGSVDFAVTGVEEKNSSSTPGVEQTIAPLDWASTELAAEASCQPTTSRVAARDLEGETTIKNATERSSEIGGKYAESDETHDRSFGLRGETTTVAGAEPAADPTATSSPRIDAEQTPRASGTAEVKGVAPPGSLERLKQSGENA